jgi:hypothetical protein
VQEVEHHIHYNLLTFVGEFLEVGKPVELLERQCIFEMEQMEG